MGRFFTRPNFGILHTQLTQDHDCDTTLEPGSQSVFDSLLWNTRCGDIHSLIRRASVLVRVADQYSCNTGIASGRRGCLDVTRKLVGHLQQRDASLARKRSDAHSHTSTTGAEPNKTLKKHQKETQYQNTDGWKLEFDCRMQFYRETL